MRQVKQGKINDLLLGDEEVASWSLTDSPLIPQREAKKLRINEERNKRKEAFKQAHQLLCVDRRECVIGKKLCSC